MTEFKNTIAFKVALVQSLLRKGLRDTAAPDSRGKAGVGFGGPYAATAELGNTTVTAVPALFQQSTAVPP